MRCHFIPGYLLERLVEHDDDSVAHCARHTHAVDDELRARRSAVPTPAAPSSGEDWQIHDAHQGSTLPGDLVRSPGDPETGDAAADEAATGITETLALFADLGRDSYDGQGATVVATVHYEKDYDNAFWDGNQLVFGDGDGKVFGRFTKPIDVLGHELSHAVTQHTANLTYQGQSGALNESLSDVFGACVKQRHLGQDAASADWLVGEGIFQPGVEGKALRSMSDPGTAYDDPRLGKDPQVGDMEDYVDTTDDNGGVHLNSGIPNRAFVLAARAIGGDSWSGAGRIWFAALTSGIRADTDFAGFAQATVDAAGEHAAEVREAWTQVGVTPGAASTPTPTPTPTAQVGVRRSGGFAGITKEGLVDLESDDPRAPQVRQLVERIDFQAVPDLVPQPDRFVYAFHYRSTSATVGEQSLTDDLRTLARLVLEED
jgi:Zn-dependent metalloprotease